MKSFPSLLKLIIECIPEKNAKSRLYQVFVQFLHLRQVISLIVRIESFNASLLDSLESHCDMLFKTCIVFDLGKPTPSLWTLCKAAPFHAKITLEEYGLGLGVNCMEGREQKHESIYKFSRNTTFQNRLSQIFCHEFVQLVHLRENGYDDVEYNKRKSSYLPITNQNTCNNCGLFLENAGVCFFCENVVVLDVIEKLKEY